MKLLLLLFLCWPVMAQPVIDNIAEGDLTHTGIRVTFTLSPAAYAHIKYSTVSGTFDSYNFGTHSTGGVDWGGTPAVPISSIAISGLAPGVWYYRIRARDAFDTDCDMTPGDCTVTAERSFTVPAAPAHPVVPTPPEVYRPSHPDTSGYDIVPLVRGADGTCEAASTVMGSDGTTSWTVTAGDKIQTILDAIRYGTVLEFATGITCEVAVASPYLLHAMVKDPNAASVDASNHRWIVFRTAADSATAFPPFGTRTGPTWLSKMAKINVSTQHGTIEGQVFRTGHGQDTAGNWVTHHFWFENIAIIYPHSAYSVPWRAMFKLGDHTHGESSYVAPRHLVLDRVYMEGSTAGDDHLVAVQYWAKYFAMIGTYIHKFEAPMTGADPYPDISNVVFGNSRDGETAGPILLENNYVQGAGQLIYFENNGQNRGNDDVTISRNFVQQKLSSMIPNAHLAGQGINFNYDGVGPRAVRQPVESKGTRRMDIFGNLIDGTWSYQNEGMFINISAISNASAAAGLTGNHDWMIRSNLMRRGGSGIHCNGSRHCSGGNCGPPDIATTSRIWIQNNLMYDFGRGIYADAGPSSGGGLVNYDLANIGCQDMTVIGNTFGRSNRQSTSHPVYGPISFTVSMFLTGMGAHIAEGFTYKNNIYYVGKGDNDGILGSQGGVSSIHIKIPTGGSSSSDYKARFECCFGTITAAGLVPSYTWTGNVAIGAGYAQYGVYSYPDMTQAETDTMHSGSQNWPGNDAWAPGETKVARETAAGIPNAATSDYRVRPSSTNMGQAGANIDQLFADMGVVSQIKVRPTASGAVFSYVAPDSRTCAIDISTDGGTTWTSRTTDAGGDRMRNTVVTGVSASTNARGRLLCYFEQLASYDLWKPDQITDPLNFTTAASGTRNIKVGFKLPAGATQVRVSATPVGGSLVQETCTVSPCALTIGAKGTHTRQLEYLNMGGTVVRTSSITYHK